MAFGLDEQRVVDFARTVRRINETGDLGIRIFSGLECDIMKEGALDIEWDALAELDIVIGSVHSHMNLESDAMTDRLLRALECPYLTAMGHPTGRLLMHRDPFAFDFDRVVTAAGRAPCVDGDQFQPGAPGPQCESCAHGEGKRRAVYRVHGRSSSEASAEPALRDLHGAAGRTGGGGRDEYALGGSVRRSFDNAAASVNRLVPGGA